MMVSIVNVEQFLNVVLLLIASILMVIHFVYIKIKVKLNNAVKYFLNGQLLLIIWNMLLLLKYIKPIDDYNFEISFLMVTSISFVSYHILAFAYSYSYKRQVTDKQSAKLILIPFISFLLYNMGLVIYEPQGYTIQVVSGSALLLYFIIGLVYFIRYTIRTEGLNKTKQWTYFYTVIGFDVYAHILFYLDIVGKMNLLFISILPLYLIFLIVLTTKYRLYDKMPFALDTIFENANHGIIVINNYSKIIEFNKKFFEKYMNANNIERFEDFSSQLKMVCDNKLSVDNILYAVYNVRKNHYSGDIKINNNDKETFLEYIVNGIYDSHNEKIATMITFRDITEITCLQDGIRNKNNQLITANNKLESHMKNVQELTVEKERELLMSEINDTFGHSMTEILALLEVSYLLLEQENNVEVAEKAIDETITRARVALDEMRAAVSKYKRGVITND